MRVKIYCGLIIFFLVLNLNLVFANNLTVSMALNTSEIWLKQSQTENYPSPIIHISATCFFNGTDVSNNSTWLVNLYDASNNLKKSSDKNSVDFSIDNNWPNGNYIVETTCQYGNLTTSTSEILHVHKLELYLKEINLTSHIGDDLTIPLEFKVDGSVDKFGLASYNLYLNENEINVDSNNLELSGDTLYLKVPISLDFSDGYRDLKLIVTYENQEIKVEKKNYVYLESPLIVEPQREEITCKANQVCETSIDMKVYYYGLGSLNDFDENNFILGVFKDEEFVDSVDLSNIICNSDTKTCSASILIPSLPPGNYKLSIKIYKGEYESVGTIPLTNVLSFSGDVLDASGKGVSLDMTLKNEDTGKIIKTSSTGGAYSINIVPGNYTISINLGSGTLLADIYNVSFNSETLDYGSNINFDSFVGTSPIDGIHLTKAVVLEFGYNFGSAKLWIPYKDSDVMNEDNLKVYRCEKWNFGRRMCNGEWVLVDSKVDAIRNIVSLETNRFGAFVLGEQKPLHFYTVAASKTEVYLGDTVPIEGKVLDSDGKEVEGAKIIISLEGYNSTTTTLSDGSFISTVKLPYKEGAFEVEVKAEKKPYISAIKKIVLRTVRKKEISVILPEQFSVELDKGKTLNLTVVNTGQTNLTDIYLHITGLSAKYYFITPSRIDQLKPNEQKTVEMRINISSDSCSEKCQQYYLVGVQAKAKVSGEEEISGGGSFTIKLNKPKVEEENSEGLFTGFSGMFVLPSTNLSDNIINYILGAAILVLLVLIFLKKKKKEGVYKRYNYRKMNLPRGNVVSNMSSIKKQIKNE